MTDYRSVLERVGSNAPQPDLHLERVLRRRDRRHRNQRIRAGVLGLTIAIGVGWLGVNAIQSSPPIPADPPTPTEGLGIFAPVAGRIVYYADSSLWGVDPNATSADSTLVRLGSGGTADADRQFASFTLPLGWSSDGTELLLMRPTGPPLLPKQTLFILHADGSETRLNKHPMGIESAAISPDGTRVVLAEEYGRHSGLVRIDAEGGRPVPLPIRDARQPTFSPDGSQIAYLAGDRGTAVWVANADGTDAHEILADDLGVTGGENLLQWSPAGDRIAIQGSQPSGDAAIFTIAPDGSDLTLVVADADSPYWSPDGSQIAFNIHCFDQLDGCESGDVSGGLTIADADGSNVRTFGFGASGPWHPGE